MVADPDRNGTFRTAQNLGNLTSVVRRRGTIGFNFNRNGRSIRDGNDFLKFRLASSGNVSIQLDQLRQDADLQVYNAARRSLGSSLRAGNTPDSLELSNLAAGVYYVKVFPGVSRARTGYRISASFSQGSGGGGGSGSGDGDGFATAINLPTVARFNPLDISGTSPVTPTITTNSVGSQDANDYYRFSISETSDLSVSISGLTADADLEIFDSNLTEIGSSARASTNTDVVNLNDLAPGTYYARVYPFSSNSTPYKLSLITSPTDGVNNNFTDRDTLDTGLLTSSGLSAIDSIGLTTDDTNDFYTFNLGTGVTSLRATISGLADDIDIQVFNGAFEKLGQSRLGGPANDSVVLTGLSSSDVYYVRVNPGFIGASSSYTLNVTPT